MVIKEDDDSDDDQSFFYDIENAVLEAMDEGLIEDSEIVDWVMSRLPFDVLENQIINALDRIESGLLEDQESI